MGKKSAKAIFQLLSIGEKLIQFKNSKLREKHFYLGLDINTKSTGFVVLNEIGNLMQSGVIDTQHCMNFVQCGVEIKRTLRQIEETHKTSDVQWEVGIEEFMKTYISGRFHTKGLFMLAQLNGITSYECYNTFRCYPQHVHPTRARSFHELSHTKHKKNSLKQAVFEYVAQRLPQHAWNPKRTGQPSDQDYDIADAYIISSYTRHQHHLQTFLSNEIITNEFIQYYVQENQKEKAQNVPDRQSLDKKGLGVYAKLVENWYKQDYLHSTLPTSASTSSNN